MNAFNQGKTARACDESRESNPYERGTAEHKQWNAGWDDERRWEKTATEQ
jgi:hypothetical protein